MSQKNKISEEKIFAQRLRELREEYDMTQKNLAARLNLSRTTIANWENGQRIPDCSTLMKLAKLFVVSVDYLCGKSDRRYNVNIPQGVNLDLTKLNGTGIDMLVDYYNFLVKKPQYQEK